MPSLTGMSGVRTVGGPISQVGRVAAMVLKSAAIQPTLAATSTTNGQRQYLSRWHLRDEVVSVDGSAGAVKAGARKLTVASDRNWSLWQDLHNDQKPPVVTGSSSVSPRHAG